MFRSHGLDRESSKIRSTAITTFFHSQRKILSVRAVLKRCQEDLCIGNQTVVANLETS
jgi:hypothetical protein